MIARALLSLFDESDEDEDGVARTYEVRDENDTSDEDNDEEDRPGAEEAATAGGAAEERSQGDSDEDDEMILDEGSRKSRQKTMNESKDEDFIPARDI